VRYSHEASISYSRSSPAALADSSDRIKKRFYFGSELENIEEAQK